MSQAVFIDCPNFLYELFDDDLRSIVPDLSIHLGDPENGNPSSLLKGAIVGINDHTLMDDKILSACNSLRVIVFMGTGASSYIDLRAAERRKIRIRTIRNYGNRSVAEHTMALMFAAGRQIASMDRSLRNGNWETLDGIEFEHKTLGIVGVGGIGKEMVRLANAIGMKVLAWNRSAIDQSLPCESCDLDEIFYKSDVVSLHLSLTEETKNLVDARRLNLLRPHCIFLNTARGGIVDEGALVKLLRDNRILHAGLDVFSVEPITPENPLLEFGNVTLTSHAGFMTGEASRRLLRTALEITHEELRTV